MWRAETATGAARLDGVVPTLLLMLQGPKAFCWYVAKRKLLEPRPDTLAALLGVSWIPKSGVVSPLIRAGYKYSYPTYNPILISPHEPPSNTSQTLAPKT